MSPITTATILISMNMFDVILLISMNMFDVILAVGLWLLCCMHIQGRMSGTLYNPSALYASTYTYRHSAYIMSAYIL